ncbi:MAG: glutamine amidotransferase [Lachnospiraceae bacterium]|jgi:CobQ-like glutamine amidotransferase family enzyme|nr:glutamine amidotransferase [Lachnospiraceae bacterium]
MELSICHLYPEVLNLYGDRGNIQCIKRRLEWRGISSSVTELKIGEQADFTRFDLYFIGGGQDFEQEVLLDDLHTGKDREIRAAINDGRTFLCICGGYQMMGTYYETGEGVRCDYLGAVDLYTVGGKTRMIDNYCFRLGQESGGSTVVGFENHSGRTYLGKGVKPLGTVLKGCGNNGEDGTEGVRFKNVYGTYSHGPVLPKNPALCDEIIRSALARKYGAAILEPLPDRFEKQAHDLVYERIMSGTMSTD